MKWLLLLLVLASGCAKQLSALAPFPCARDQSCPLGLVCVPGVGCTAAQLDGLCTSETDCSAAGGDCRLGICATACGAACGAGRVCARAQGDEACVQDCSTDGGCAPGLECQGLWVGSLRGCLPPGRGPVACLGTVAEEKPVCGAASFTVSCGNGNSCTVNSHCVGGGTSCACDPGYVAWNCTNDTPCSSSNRCPYPSWWCLPEGLASSCLKDPAFTPGHYQCADGRQVRATCEASCQSVCEDSSACDPVRQTCGPVARSRCTFVEGDAGVVATCVAPAGAVELGKPCARPIESGAGVDDCAAGGVCSIAGMPGVPSCRSFCESSAGCDAGAHCVGVTETPRAGLCAPTCALFGDCGVGATCSPARDLDDHVFARCREKRRAALGDPCTLQTDCDDAQLCAVQADGGEGCAALCDPAHPCVSGTCTRIGNSALPDGSGFCLE